MILVDTTGNWFGDFLEQPVAKGNSTSANVWFGMHHAPWPVNLKF